MNWIASLEKNNIKKYAVFCFDDGICNKLKGKNAMKIPPSWIPVVITNTKELFMSRKFIALTHYKLHVVYHGNP